MKVLHIPFLICLLFTASCGGEDNLAPDEENSAPEKFNLIAVTAEPVDPDVKLTFTWEAAADPDGDAVTYDLYLDTVINPSMLIAGNLTATNYTYTSSLSNDKTYYWKVVAKDAEDKTASAVSSFSIEDLNFPNNPPNTASRFSGRAGHTSVVFDKKMWVIGGLTGKSYKNDVWYSSDGLTWTEATGAASFSGRAGHKSIVFDNKIWLIGGLEYSFFTDVWYSSNGVTWTEATGVAPFGGRAGHSLVVFDNKIWVIGGNSGDGRKNDVWYSSDGIVWTEATSAAAFSKRYGHTSVVFDGKMWVISGNDENNPDKNEVWYSTDGVIWTKATGDALFSARFAHTSVVFDSKMWVIGGFIENFISLPGELWYSSDGATWTKSSDPDHYIQRFSHTSIVFDDKFWVIAGNPATGDAKNDAVAFD